ncbi:hypothetical protein AAFF_G00311230 [Aldrovandia affinis]|uniref:Uncharacterized protein n=1 Tax=Aldrovandia affinis TaxID=143900 RepID=A0AAD7R851_9TELE|nr:hypothetical protein AAFF_G00311230 [Aldrovandia affinis]
MTNTAVLQDSIELHMQPSFRFTEMQVSANDSENASLLRDVPLLPVGLEDRSGSLWNPVVNEAQAGSWGRGVSARAAPLTQGVMMEGRGSGTGRGMAGSTRTGTGAPAPHSAHPSLPLSLVSSLTLLIQNV